MASNEPITKLEIATAHVTTSLILIATEASPYSTHLPVMAANEIILTVAKKTGRQLEYDPEVVIRPDKVDQFRSIMRKPYNYSKHADRDHDEPFVPSETQDLATANDMQTFLNIYGLSKLGATQPDCHRSFQFLLGNWKPNLLQWEKLERSHPQLQGLRDTLPEMNRDLYIRTLRAELQRCGVMPA